MTSKSLPNEVEAVAQWLHDETDDPESFPDYTWPEHPDDTGQRGDGWVKIVPKDVQARFRERAVRLFKRFPAIAAMQSRSIPDVDGLVERAIIDAIEAQFDIHAMDPEDWAEMSCAIRQALLTLSSEIERKDEALNAAFDFLGGVDGAAKIRDTILQALSPRLSSGVK